MKSNETNETKNNIIKKMLVKYMQTVYLQSDSGSTKRS